MKKFCYLVQGKKSLLEKNFSYLKKNKNRDVFFLSYDEPIDGHIYFPKSTWSEGRHKLLEVARKEGATYRYYVFLDDDAVFIRGSIEDMEEIVFKNQPLLAAPVVPRTHGTNLSFLNFQVMISHDQQCLYYAQEMVNDVDLFPMKNHLDHKSWWIACSVQEIIIFNKYRNKCLQINTCEISNDQHGTYDLDESVDYQKEAKQVIANLNIFNDFLDHKKISLKNRKAKKKKLLSIVDTVCRTIIFKCFK